VDSVGFIFSVFFFARAHQVRRRVSFERSLP
jgi:hypothetical protein